MATSLLRLGRLGPLKCLQQEGWGSLRTPLTATFCTKAEAPKKSAKKASSKSKSKTLEAPDERAALLAYKTTVAFPTRLSTPGFLSQGVALGEYEQNGDPVTNAVAAGAASAQPAPSTAQVLAKPSSEESTTAADAKQSESVTTPAAETATEKDATIPTSADVEALKSEVTPKDDEDTSSSSSSSDSDSDSDSDDEKPDKTELAKPVVHTEDKAGQDEKPSAVSEEHASDVKTRAVPEHVEPSVPEGAPKGAVKGAPQEAEVVSEPKFKKVPDPSTASAPSEDIVDPAPVLCTAASVKAQANVIPESETGVEVKSSEVSGAIPKPVTKSAPDVSAEPTPEVVLDSATKVASEPEPEIKTAPKTPKAVAAAEELVDTAPAITAAEEVRADPDVSAAPEEAAAAPAPAPEPEPFDNTTYKNLQHHSYNIYTFVDMDVEMAKNRLPQPSTGRPSPRH